MIYYITRKINDTNTGGASAEAQGQAWFRYYHPDKIPAGSASLSAHVDLTLSDVVD